MVNPEGLNPNRSAPRFQSRTIQTRFDSRIFCLLRHPWIQCIVSTIITEWVRCCLHSGPSSTTTRHIKGLHNPNKYLTLHKYPTFVQQYSWLTRQLNYNKSSRRLSPAHGLYNLISHSGSFCQILTELIISTISLGSSSKSIQTSGWPIRFHQL